MAVDLTTNIVIGGSTTAGFDSLAGKIAALGAQVNQVSEKAQRLLEEGVDTYRDYEDKMLDVRGKLLSDWDGSATGFEEMMGNLESYAQKWASSTIYHTDDVAQAMLEAAQAGWRYEQIVSGLPAVMTLAQAGGLTLSQALDYTAKSLASTGTEFDDLAYFMDQWVIAANKSPTTVEEIGEALLRLGASGRFADSTQELFTMAAALAQVGLTGSDAGTQMRNLMLRLGAPTGTAFGFLATLGMTEEELESISTYAQNLNGLESFGIATTTKTGELRALSDILADAYKLSATLHGDERETLFGMLFPIESVLGVAQRNFNITEEEARSMWDTFASGGDLLSNIGFSAFDVYGNMKPVLQIFREIATLMDESGMGEADQMDFLRNVFGMRSASAAKAMIDAARNDYGGLFEDITDSEGKAASMSEIMMSGLTGSIETLLSKWEEFERKIGEQLAPSINSVADFLSGILDSINGMDDTEFAALTGAIEGVAAAGPGLLVAATAMEMMESPLGAATLLTVAVAAGIGAIAGALSELDAQGYRSTFGDMSVDMGALNEALQEVNNNLGPAMSVFTEHAAAAKEAAAAYKEAGQALAEGLFMMMATGAAFDPNGAEAKAMMAYGESMYASIEKGLGEAAAGQLGFLSLLFEGNEEDESFGTLSGLISSGFDEAIATAEQKSQELRAAMTSAFADGMLTEAEIVSIQSIIDQMNELMALESPANLEYAKLLNRSQTVSIDAMGKYSDEVSAARDAALADYDEQFENNLALLRLRYDQALRNGSTFINPVTGDEMRASDIDFDAAVAQAQARYAQQRARWSSQYDDMLMRAWETAFASSGSGDAYRAMQDIVRQFQSGDISANKASALLNNVYDPNARYMGRAMEEAIEAFGGGEAMMAAIGTLTGMGGLENMERASWMQGLLMMAGRYGKGGFDLNAAYGLGSSIKGTWRPGYDDSDFLDMLYYGKSGSADSKGYEGGGEGWDIEATVTFEANTEAPDNYQPEDKTAYINYIPRRMNGGGGKGATLLEEFAEGGRSDTPAIFGEEGAEWAIPEEHSERTADLLNAAREASGFTWDDLIRRNGGLNANARNRTVNIEYAPVINAADAAGVQSILEADKARVEKLIREALENERMREEIENYA